MNRREEKDIIDALMKAREERHGVSKRLSAVGEFDGKAALKELTEIIVGLGETTAPDVSEKPSLSALAKHRDEIAAARAALTSLMRDQNLAGLIARAGELSGAKYFHDPHDIDDDIRDMIERLSALERLCEPAEWLARNRDPEALPALSRTKEIVWELAPWFVRHTGKSPTGRDGGIGQTPFETIGVIVALACGHDIGPTAISKTLRELTRDGDGLCKWADHIDPERLAKAFGAFVK